MSASQKVLAASILLLSGCAFRPSNGIQDGQIVYAKASCEKRMVRDWDVFIGFYRTISQDGTIHDDFPVDLTPTKAGCINWKSSP